MEKFHGEKYSYFFNTRQTGKGKKVLEITASRKNKEGQFIRTNIKIAFEDLEQFKLVLNAIE